MVISFMSCDLTNQQDETQCDKNAMVDDECATAVVDQYKHNPGYANMVIRLSYSGGSVIKISIHPTNGVIEAKKYNYYLETDLWFAAINQGKSGSVTITTFDTVNNLISGKFDFDAEGVSNSQTYDFHADGYFNKVKFP